MLPFDLHVLGLPPAFTLSQDQTLHLKFSTRLKVASNASSADVFSRTRTTHQHLHAFESFLLFLERLLMDSHHQPDVRISILRTLSKIFGSGLSACFPVLRSFLRSEPPIVARFSLPSTPRQG